MTTNNTVQPCILRMHFYACLTCLTCLTFIKNAANCIIFVSHLSHLSHLFYPLCTYVLSHLGSPAGGDGTVKIFSRYNGLPHLSHLSHLYNNNNNNNIYRSVIIRGRPKKAVHVRQVSNPLERQGKSHCNIKNAVGQR
jgi:hypothetical protein